MGIYLGPSDIPDSDSFFLLWDLLTYSLIPIGHGVIWWSEVCSEGPEIIPCYVSRTFIYRHWSHLLSFLVFSFLPLSRYIFIIAYCGSKSSPFSKYFELSDNLVRPLSLRINYVFVLLIKGYNINTKSQKGEKLWVRNCLQLWWSSAWCVHHFS